MTGTIVVGLDGSVGSKVALQWAVEEARLRGSVLRAVHVWSYLDQPEGEFDPAYGEGDARRVLDESLAGLDVEVEVEVERVVVNDLPARGLLAAAKGADLVVVGALGAGGFEGLLLGSVSQQVAHHATCPVVIVPSRR